MGDQRYLRAELEQIWRARLQESRQKYDLSVAQTRKVLSDQKRFAMPAGDGFFAVQHAHRQESAARNEYARVLKIFMDLVVSGKVPDGE
jgi:hypothetical protein